jgi:hypothetical protein
MNVKLQSILDKVTNRNRPGNRRGGTVAMAALGSILLQGPVAPVACTPPPHTNHTGLVVGTGAIALGAIIGTVVMVEVHNDRHTIKGCVSVSQNGLEVQDMKDNKSYKLLGVTANTRVGDVVKLHGTKEKAKKDSGGDPAFVVEKVSRDYGTCKVSSGPAASAAVPAEPAQAR